MKRLLVIALIPALLACSSNEDAEPVGTGDAAPGATTAPTSSAPTTVAPPTTEAPVEPITVLVTNDDGIAAGGIDTVVTALSSLDWVEVVIVAPAENQSGTSDSTSPSTPPSSAATTASGVEGVAVQGFPADSVLLALDQLGVTPDLVVSGINAGQNIGPFVELSGTVGAARTAARRGIPAVAASAGLVTEGEPDYATVAELVLAWFADNQEALLDGTLPVAVTNINAPTCAPGTAVRGVLEVPVAAAIPEGVDPFATDCASTVEAPADDVAAVVNGFASISDAGF
jgi:5'-nucleotidase